MREAEFSHAEVAVGYLLFYQGARAVIDSARGKTADQLVELSKQIRNELSEQLETMRSAARGA